MTELRRKIDKYLIDWKNSKDRKPLKANYNPDNYRLYFGDTGLLIGSLDEESQKDLRNNQNFGTYKGDLNERNNR